MKLVGLVRAQRHGTKRYLIDAPICRRLLQNHPSHVSNCTIKFGPQYFHTAFCYFKPFIAMNWYEKIIARIKVMTQWGKISTEVSSMHNRLMVD
jgi:hypothetical protein